MFSLVRLPINCIALPAFNNYCFSFAVQPRCARLSRNQQGETVLAEFLFLFFCEPYVVAQSNFSRQLCITLASFRMFVKFLLRKCKQNFNSFSCDFLLPLRFCRFSHKIKIVIQIKLKQNPLSSRILRKYL